MTYRKVFWFGVFLCGGTAVIGLTNGGGWAVLPTVGAEWLIFVLPVLLLRNWNVRRKQRSRARRGLPV